MIGRAYPDSTNNVIEITKVGTAVGRPFEVISNTNYFGSLGDAHGFWNDIQRPVDWAVGDKFIVDDPLYSEPFVVFSGTGLAYFSKSNLEIVVGFTLDASTTYFVKQMRGNVLIEEGNF